MKQGRHVVILVLLGLIGVACETGGDRVSSSPDGEAGRAEDQRLVVSYGPDEFVTEEINMKRLGMYPLNVGICEPLVQLGRDFSVEEGLATDWEHVGENTVRFSLREGVTFHDGSDLDAEAVRYTLDYTAEEPQTGGFAAVEEDSTEVVDDMTVDVTPGEPNRRLVEQINHPTYGIMAPGSDPLNEQNPVCTGPFELASYTEEEDIVVERFDGYWGEPAELEQIRFRFMDDDSTRALALQSDEVDVVLVREHGIVESLEEDPNIKIVNAPPGQVILFYIAQRGPDGEEKVTADPQVREAIAHAIDRDSYVENVLDGRAERVDTVNPPAILGQYAEMVEGVPYDPEEARRLLEEAGWTEGPDGVRTKDGEPLELTIIFDPARITLSTPEYVQAQLREVGIDARVDQLEAAAYRERLNETADYHIDISAPNQNDGDPAFLLALRWRAKSSVPNAEFIAPGPDTSYERLVDQTREVTDPDELRRLAAEAMKVLVEEEVATVPLAGTFRIWAMRTNVQGFEPHPSGINQRWDTIYLTE